MRTSVEVGFGCNNACVFCAQGRLRSTTELPAFERLAQRISELPVGAPVAIVGGEPTLRPDLIELIALAKRRTDRILLQTNARRLAVAGYADGLAAAGVAALDVSLHGSTEAMHDYHSGVAGSFRQTIAGLGRARAARLAFGITTVVTRSNVRHLAQIANVAHTLGARAVHFAALEQAGSAARERARLQVPAAFAGPELSRAIATLERLGIDWLAGDRASRSEVRDWFAGTGTREDVSPASVPSSSNRSARERSLELPQAGLG